MTNHRAVFAAALAFASSAFAQRYEQDPYAHREAALAVAARDPVGDVHLQHARASITSLGLTTETTFGLINASRDEAGGSHARLQQYFRGVKVRGAELLSHVDAQGAFTTTDSLQRGIVIPTTPTLSVARAVDVVWRQAGQPVYAWDPRTELLVEPIVERVLARTGRPAPTPTFDRTDPNSPVDDLNAADVLRRTTGHRLTWSIHTVEGREGFNESIKETDFTVDASSGEIVHQKALAPTGSGTGFFSGNVPLSTSIDLGGFAMRDLTRNFRTVDEGFNTFSGSNVDSNDVWGDGVFFKGTLNNASLPNRQTAMVDGHFGASVYWDMVSKVFKRKGPDGAFYDVNIHTHVGSAFSPLIVWDNANYSPTTGNISLGDGTSRQALDCLGHEEGHGLNDFSADLSGDMGDGINESHADIMGALTALYLGGGGFNAGSTKIPSTVTAGFPTPFRSRCSNRNLMKPTKGGGANRSDFWFAGIENLPDEHDIGQPNNRAFFFLAQGASPFMKSDAYSPLLPWGMTGVGNDLAGRIWVQTMTTPFIISNPDYVDVRAAVNLGAMMNLSANLGAMTAVANAYAGIAVGSTGPGYPAAPAPALSASNNLTKQTCQTITLPNTPIGASVPGKLKLFATGNASRFYCVSLPKGASVTVRVNPMFAGDDWDLVLSSDLGGSPLQIAQLGKGKYDLIDQLAGSGVAGLGESYVIEVKPFSLTSPVGIFTLDFDRY